MNVVLISTYELGHQPFGLTSAAAWLKREGAGVVLQDAAVQHLDKASLAVADLIGFYVPMHTATRIAAPLRTAVRAKGIMVAMGRAGFLVLLLVAGCAHRKQMNLLEKEKLQFRAENEKLRAEDLEERYQQQKKKADALSRELLALERDRDRLYAQYDVLRGETGRLDREVKASGERAGAMAKALAEAKAEEARLQAELDAERKAISELEEQLRAAQAKRAELGTTEKPDSE